MRNKIQVGRSFEDKHYKFIQGKLRVHLAVKFLFIES